MSDLSQKLAALPRDKRDELFRRLKGASDQAPASGTAAPTAGGPEPIAIVGMSCGFPGGSDSPDAFWRAIVTGADAISEVPQDRWDADKLFDPDPTASGKVASRWGGFLRSVDEFDAGFFGISPREAHRMDPQQRLLLEVAWEALEDAGQDVERLAGSLTGVFVGLHSYSSDYFWMQLDRPERFDTFTGTGSAHNIASGRLSYLWDLRGPSLVVDTACSSSLVAVHLACQSLRAGESDLALAAGVNLILSPLFTIALSRLRMLSPTGRCRTFDAHADGFVRGEGCGVVVLKRLGDAVKNGDNILALIRGSAVNQDGKTNGITAPSSRSQEAVIRQALRSADVDPATIGYIEAHGTGTPIGDPIEIEALATVFAGRTTDLACALGSAKANIGHLEGAAGIAGLIKAVLALRHQTIPPMALFTALNPHLSLDNTPFDIPVVPRPWPKHEAPRRAGISSFGWSGTNAHVIVEEAPAATIDASDPADCTHVLTISAKSEEALRTLSGEYRTALTTGGLSATPLRDVCYTANVRRTRHDYRAAVCGRTHDEIAAALSALTAGERRWDVSSRRAVGGRNPQLVFVFCGQGAQSPGMGVELLSSAPAFAESLARTDELVRAVAGWSLIDELRAAEGQSRLDQTEIAQPALFALQVALAEEWRRRGVVPATLLGHSVGEIAAAHVAGVLSLEDAVKVVVHRARLMQRTTGYGRMVSVPLSLAEAEALVKQAKGALSLAAENSPRSCVLSGDTTIVTRTVRDLETRGISARLLPVNYAFHSRQMEPILGEFREAINGILPRAPKTPIVSTVSGQLAKAGDFDSEYWVRNLRQPVRFSSAVSSASRSPRSVLLEIGPHPVLAASIAECAAEKNADMTVVASLQRGRPEAQSMMAGLGSLFTAGCVIDWPALFSGRRAVVPLPSYPWQRERYWIPERSGSEPMTVATEGWQFPGTRLRSPLFEAIVFESRLSAGSPSYLADHRVGDEAIFPASALLALAASAGSRILGDRAIELRDIVVQQPLRVPDANHVQVHTILEKSGHGYAFRIASLPSEEANTWTTHASGTIAVADLAAPIAFEMDPASTAEPVDPTAHYSELERSGLSFGPAFRCIDRLSIGAGMAAADLRLPEIAEPQGEEPIHPVVLDGAFHALWTAMPRELVSGSTYLPFTIERARFYRAASGPVRAVGRRGRKISAGGETLTGDIAVFNEHGELVADVQGFTFKRMGVADSVAARRRAVRQWLYEPVWTAQPRPATKTASRSKGSWILAGKKPETGAVARQLELLCKQCPVIVHDAASTSEISNALKQSRVEGIVLFATGNTLNLESSPEALVGAQANSCTSLLSLVQAIVASNSPPLPSLVVITSGAERIEEGVPEGTAVVSLEHAPLWGLARSIRMELPELHCTLIDLDPSAAFDAQAKLVAEEIHHGSDDVEVAFRGGVRAVRRLRRVDSLPMASTSPVTDGPVQLRIPVKGMLDNLVLEPNPRRAPGPGEIEIEVKAAGMNFRDVLNALGMYPGEAGPLGSECAGTVVAVGDGVTALQPGQHVMAVGEGTLGTHVVTRAALAAPKPDRLSFAEAAGVPIAFLTVHEALVTTARIQPGDRVLIHAAAGGVGLAAVQLALSRGAEVFATAGSEHKREFLKSLGVQHVMNSRTLDFAWELMDATGGAGVDIVLNSLNGEFIERSLAVMAHNGRFVELGKIGIWTREDVARFRKDIEYTVLYLGDLFEAAPDYIGETLAGLGSQIANRELYPLPVTSFRLSEAEAAFRYMAQAQHIGKVVLTPTAGAELLRSDATYLITGGFGALGLTLAEWMVKAGARSIVLASRREPTAPQRAQIDRLSRRGARITAALCDVSKEEDVVRVVRDIQGFGPALRGIIHTAGVLDDGVALQQTRERFQKVLAPKTAGAWNLHRATANDPLDFIVFFSSIASMLGSPGQSNYAASNAFLDAFARQLRIQGVPASSISWGIWGQGGMAVGVGGRNKERWAEQGLQPMDPSDAVVALELALESKIPHLGILSVDWDRYVSHPVAASLRPLIGELAEPATAKQGEPARPPAINERLRRVPAGQRRGVLQQHLRDRVLKVLGLAGSYALDPHQGLREVGLDSLLAIELRNTLQSDLQGALPATLAFDYPTVEALTDFLSSGPLAAVMGVDAGAAAATENVASVRAVAELSEEEAEALLLAELTGARTDKGN